MVELGQPHLRGLEGLISGKGERLNKSIDCANQAADSLFMSENWTDHELDMCVRAYMWMLDAQNRGYTSVIKAKVDRALRAGPLDGRGKLDYRFANIASRVEAKRLEILVGYKPQAHVGANISGIIDGFIERYQNGERHQRRLDCLVKEIPSGDFSLAAEKLASGVVYDFPGSTTYDVAFNGSRIPPKKLTSYASLLYYGAPLFSDNFVGAKVGIAFKKIRESGLVIVDKDEEPDDNIDSPEFRSKVKQARKELRKKATGNLNPKKKTSVSTGYDRDPYVVADILNISAKTDENTFQQEIQIGERKDLSRGKVSKKEKKAVGVSPATWPRDVNMSYTALDDANYKCENDTLHATFVSGRTGKQFVEAHHLVPMEYQDDFEVSIDVPENIISLCPNCHRAFHLSEDQEKTFLIKKFHKLRAQKLKAREIFVNKDDLLRYYLKNQGIVEG